MLNVFVYFIHDVYLLTLAQPAVRCCSAQTASGVVHDVTPFLFLSLQPGRVVTLIEDDDVSGKLYFLLVG